MELPEKQQTWTAWKTKFMEEYVAKKCDKAAREGEEKPCGGAASDAARDKLRRKAATSSAPTPM